MYETFPGPLEDASEIPETEESTAAENPATSSHGHKALAALHAVTLAGTLAAEEGVAQSMKQPVKPGGIEQLRETHEEVAYKSGMVIRWESGRKEKGDYFPSGKRSLLASRPDRHNAEKADLLSGGFPEDLRLETHFGISVDTVESEKVDQLLEQYADHISIDGETSKSADEALRAAFMQPLEDRYLFIALRSFFEDGGHIRIQKNLANDSGKYTGANKGADGKITAPHIFLGFDASVLNGRSLVRHELLHYIFDKSNAWLGEQVSAGGIDHLAMDALENRAAVVDLLSMGKNPWDESSKKVDDLENILGAYGPMLRGFVQSNDAAGLLRETLSEKFYASFVQASMRRPLSYVDYMKKNPGKEKGDNDLSPENLADIAYVHATTASILQQSFRLAAAISTQKKITLAQAFEDPSYQEQLKQFLRDLATQQRNLPQASVNRNAAAIMTRLTAPTPLKK